MQSQSKDLVLLEKMPKSTATKATKASSASKPKVSKKKPSPPKSVVEEVEVVEEVPEVVESSSVSTEGHRTRKEKQLDSIFQNLEDLDNLLLDVIAETSSLKLTKLTRSLKQAEKLTGKVFKSLDRVTKKKTGSKSESTSVSGFNIPIKISPEMAKFTGHAPGDLVSRTEVTRHICQYVKENGLQDPVNKKEIRVEKDKKLVKLLNYDPKKATKPVTWIGIQSHIKHHFPKA